MVNPTKFEALIIVDLQEGFINRSNQHVVSRVERLQHQYQYVYASQFMLDTQEQNEMFLRENLAFAPREDAKIFQKSTHNAATNEIIQDLRSTGVQQVHVCGVETNVCVLATAIALLDEGFYVVVRTEACASNSRKYDWDEEKFHRAALMMMKNMSIRTWGF